MQTLDQLFAEYDSAINSQPYDINRIVSTKKAIRTQFPDVYAQLNVEHASWLQRQSEPTTDDPQPVPAVRAIETANELIETYPPVEIIDFQDDSFNMPRSPIISPGDPMHGGEIEMPVFQGEEPIENDPDNEITPGGSGIAAGEWLTVGQRSKQWYSLYQFQGGKLSWLRWLIAGRPKFGKTKQPVEASVKQETVNIQESGSFDWKNVAVKAAIGAVVLVVIGKVLK